MKINTNKKAGFTLVEIMIVVAIIGLLAAIAIPNFVRARKASQKNACINNMRLIDGAASQYQLENANAAVPTLANVRPYLGRGDGTVGGASSALPVCPRNGAQYVLNTASTPSTSCTFAAGDGVGFEHQLPQ